MNQHKSYLLLTGAFVLIASALFFLLPRPSTLADLERLSALEARVETDLSDNQTLQASMNSLIGRLDNMEVRLNDRSRESIEAQREPSQALPPNKMAPSTATATITPKDFHQMMPKMVRVHLEGTATAEEEQAFWEAARSTNMVDEAIARLEMATEAYPTDDEARMSLADSYVVKLLTVPAGPERGIWGMKAETQWQAVIENNPDNWDAQYALAYNYSMYPDFVSKTEEAVAGFENAIAIQQRNTAKPEHSRTYLHLARLYKKQGEPERARHILEQGINRHPGNQAIRKALQASK